MRFKNNARKPKDNLLKYKNEIIQFSGVGVNLKKKTKKAKTDRQNNLSRKMKRKLERNLKHVKNMAFHSKKKVPTLDSFIEEKLLGKRKKKGDTKKKTATKKDKKKTEDEVDDGTLKKRKIEQLKYDDERDDMEIRKLEKLLHIKKDRKTYKQSFYDDGVDDILDFCDKEKRADVLQNDGDYNAWFQVNDKEEVKNEDSDEMGSEDEEQIELHKSQKKKEKLKELNKEFKKGKRRDEDEDDDEHSNLDGEYDSDEHSNLDGDGDEDGFGEDDFEDESEEDVKPTKQVKNKIEAKAAKKVQEVKDEVKEDIYGRLIDSKGNVIKQKVEIEQPDQTVDNSESALKLSKQLKGLFNRLTTSNMNTIINECTRVYYSNLYTRNQFIQSIYNLFEQSLFNKNNLTPERILCEHAAFLCVLSTQIGNDLNIKLLEKFLNLFLQAFKNGQNYSVDVKLIDNILIFLCFLYNFKLFSSKLIFSIINDKLLVELTNEKNSNFIEKFIELLVHILSKIGFLLRKDSPNDLKDLIDTIKLKLSKLTESFDDNDGVNMRLKFMMESLNAIKNNNIRKLSGYNPDLCENIFKQIKTLFNTNTNVTQLNITLNDFLMANKNGKWWIVGSAWSNNAAHAEEEEGAVVDKVKKDRDNFNEKLLTLAKKQHMNTDIRKNIFCIIMSSEDYADAFTKLMKLALKKQQEREIVYVIVHCVLNEKHYNGYYSFLMQKFCEFDRRFKMTLQFHTWDKFKLFSSMTTQQVINFAYFYSHLISSKCMSLSIFKNASFGEMDRMLLCFLRNFISKLFDTNSTIQIQEIFMRITTYPKLIKLRQALKLFISHFIMTDKGRDIELSEDVREKCQLVLKCLTVNLE